MADSSSRPSAEAAGPSRRALIAGVAGLVAGAVAQGTSTRVEASHGTPAVDPNAMHVNQLNTAANATKLLKVVNNTDPTFELINPYRTALLAHSTDGRAGVFFAGDFAPTMTDNISTAFETAIWGLGCDDETTSGVIGMTCDSVSSAQAIISQIGNMNPAGIIAASDINNTSLVAANFGGGNALDVIGAARFSSCGHFTHRRGRKSRTIIDARITADSMILLNLVSNPGPTTLRYTECSEGKCVVHLSDDHPTADIECNYMIFECLEMPS